MAILSSKEWKDQFSDGINRVLKKYNMKGSIKVRRGGYTPDLIVTLRKGAIDFEVDKSGGNDSLYVSSKNPPAINDDFKGLPKKFLQELHKEMMGKVWYNRSDSQTDYFDMSHTMHIDIGGGKDKPYVVTSDKTKVYQKYGKGMDSGRVGALVEGYRLKEDSLAYHEYKQREKEGEKNLKVDGWALGDEHLILPLKKGYINHPVKNKLLQARGETVPDDSSYKKFHDKPLKEGTKINGKFYPADKPDADKKAGFFSQDEIANLRGEWEINAMVSKQQGTRQFQKDKAKEFLKTLPLTKIRQLAGLNPENFVGGKTSDKKIRILSAEASKHLKELPNRPDGISPKQVKTWKETPKPKKEKMQDRNKLIHENVSKGLNYKGESFKKLDNKSAENLAKKQKSLSKLEAKLNSLKKQYEADQKDYQKQLLDNMPKSKFKQSLMKPSMPVYKSGDVKVTLQNKNKKRLNKLFGRTYKRRK